MKELYSILVYLAILVLPNTRRTSGSNVEETERYKIDGKISIQGFKPSGKDFVIEPLCCMFYPYLTPYFLSLMFYRYIVIAQVNYSY